MTGPVNNAETTTHEHPTPQSIIDAAHATMGYIDLDPASTEEFNKLVNANFYYTKENNGINQYWGWAETIFLNPPGSQSPKGQPRNPSCHEWLDKLVFTMEDEEGNTRDAIYIGYNGPETLSRRPQCCRAADGVLWTSVEGTASEEEGFIKTSGRVKFLGDRPYFPSIILYFGPHVDQFYENFAKFGTFLVVE